MQEQEPDYSDLNTSRFSCSQA